MILFLYEFKNQCRLSNYSNFNRSYYMEIYILSKKYKKYRDGIFSKLYMSIFYRFDNLLIKEFAQCCLWYKI